ncbi:MAG: glycosyltransferase [Desulfobacterales bacterium]|jgi:glycosyltransferase involved in cell wall biosynthesis
MRADLHVHSKYSRRPSQWFLQKIGCPESFTEPLDLYRIAHNRGMSLVTITDHNRIDGALEIAYLPGTFISEEVTSYFPEDQCKVHVLVFNINESQHEDIQKFRSSLYDLVEYLQMQSIPHALAHPMYAVNDHLTVEHFEKCLLLFKNFELNGDFSPESNECLKQILMQLNPEDIFRLADKHSLLAKIPEPWEKAFVGGSDDHSSLNIARTFTEVANADSLDTFLHGFNTRETTVVSQPSSPLNLARNLYSIAYQFYRQKLGLGNFVPKDDVLKFIDHSLRSLHGEPSGFLKKLHILRQYRRQKKIAESAPDTMMELLRRETGKLFAENPQLFSITENDGTNYCDLEKRWFIFVKEISNRVLLQFANHLLDHFSGAHLFNIFHTIGSAGGFYTLLVPYFVAFAQYNKHRHFQRMVEKRFQSQRPGATSAGFGQNVAIFTDTFYGINEVALTLQQQVTSATKYNQRLTVVTCDGENFSGKTGIRNFKPIGAYDFSAYPESKLFYPPLMEMLEFCYQENFTRIHAATPGPIGMAALLVAKLLKLPINGTYHTSLPLYAQFITGDGLMEQLAWKYTIWFYNQMGQVYVPSQSTFDELVQRGIDSDKIRLLPNGVDIERFHPGKNNGFLKKRYRVNDSLKLLYVGRVSKEKNLHMLAQAFKLIYQQRKDAQLIVVGDGPYLDEMQNELRKLPCIFTGYLKGDNLATVYASCDIFIYPSTTDSFGQVVLEAQASGLPAIVTDRGGPQENIIAGKTGLAIKGDDTHSIVEALNFLISNPTVARAMGRSARQYMEERFFDGAFHHTWKIYGAAADDFNLPLPQAI